MKSEKVSFTNDQGHDLSARLDLPADRSPHHYVLFAHCFTCGKDLHAVRNISRALTGRGFGVLRFDFTGLGASEGEFSETSFSSNISDLHAAIRHMEKAFAPPALLIGHSLGGAAAIVAGAEAASIQAVVTIGAPADIHHVQHLFKEDLDEIRAKGSAEVRIAGRSFTIRQDFIDDLQQRDLQQILKQMRKPLLIAHSPQDAVVGIDNAALLYQAAMHPKSFLSLDGADHLLSDAQDAIYAGDMIAAWVKRYLPESPVEELPDSDHRVVAHIANEGFTTQLRAGGHDLTVDEPVNVGGNGFGPTPYDLLGASLAACTAMTMKMYAQRKGWDLADAYVHVSHSKSHAQDCEACVNQSARIDHFDRLIELRGDLDEDQRKRLLEIADKCPVHRTLHGEVQVGTRLGGLES
jgi:uncharacterized OsmC-like protein/esterase/lipase